MPSNGFSIWFKMENLIKYISVPVICIASVFLTLSCQVDVTFCKTFAQPSKKWIQVEHCTSKYSQQWCQHTTHPEVQSFYETLGHISKND